VFLTISYTVSFQKCIWKIYNFFSTFGALLKNFVFFTKVTYWKRRKSFRHTFSEKKWEKWRKFFIEQLSESFEMLNLTRYRRCKNQIAAREGFSFVFSQKLQMALLCPVSQMVENNSDVVHQLCIWRKNVCMLKPGFDCLHLNSFFPKPFCFKYPETAENISLACFKWWIITRMWCMVHINLSKLHVWCPKNRLLETRVRLPASEFPLPLAFLL
jgi:hypothetical protein